MNQFNISSSIASLVNDCNACMTRDEIQLLESCILDSTLDHSTLLMLSNLLKRPCLCMNMITLFRPILLDLIALWKTMKNAYVPCSLHDDIVIPSSPKHDRSGLLIHHPSKELDILHTVYAFSRILPLAPQVKRLDFLFLSFYA